LEQGIIRKRLTCMPTGVALLAAMVALAGCSPKTNVSATGNVPAQYNHVFITTQQLWFNTSTTAGPDDTSWQKFPLTTPVSIDLFNASGGTVAQLGTSLGVSAGTYAQIRLLPIDSSAALTSSASALGALYNSEVDYTDSAGKTHQAPLELQNPDKGIGIATNITIATGVNTNTSLGTGTVASTSTSTSTSTTQTDTGFFNGTLSNGVVAPGTGTTGIVSADAGTGTTTTGATVVTSGTGGSTLSPLTVAINFDASRDLAFFDYGTATGILMNPHPTAYSVTGVGAIQGSIALTGLPGVTSSNGHLPIQVTAEALSADGTRHLPVASTAVTTGGTFILYPLPTSSSSTATYDLVIHGAGIATVILRGVPVNVGDPASTTPVSIGTVAPRATGTFAVNLNATNPLPAGALVGFYQTLPLTGEVPYLIEERTLDPFSRTLQSNATLNAGTIDFGTFVSGAQATFTTATPSEGVSTYRASAIAPLFADGALTTTVFPAPVTPVLVAVPTLSVVSGATADTLSVTVTQTTPGKYNAGELIISRGGAIVATASLDPLLSQGGGGTLAVNGIPGGSSSTSFAAALYYISVRTWNSANPAGTLNRETYPNPADLRNGSISGYALNID
jgi:hypothetical protein